MLCLLSVYSLQTLCKNINAYRVSLLKFGYFYCFGAEGFPWPMKYFRNIMIDQETFLKINDGPQNIFMFLFPNFHILVIVFVGDVFHLTHILPEKSGG